MSTQHPSADETMQAILAGVYATSLAVVRAVQESQNEAFGDNPDGTRDINLAGGLASTAQAAATAARDLTQAYVNLKGLPAA